MAKKNIIIALIILLIAGGVYYALRIPRGGADALSAPLISGADREDIAGIQSYQYTETYANPTYNFTFRYPRDFATTEIPDESGGEAITVQNIESKIGVQILISPFDEADVDLTKEIVESEIPDMQVTDPQEVLIGTTRKGLAFMSDNEAFGGASREVWFVFGGNLYQISTYAELDPFLKGLFATWQFQ